MNGILRIEKRYFKERISKYHNKEKKIKKKYKNKNKIKYIIIVYKKCL